MSRLFRLSAAWSILLAFGCAHRISITPALGTIDTSGISRIEKNVGYYISPEDLGREVVTGGGGGDKVKYFPYKEAEPALRQVLSNIFSQVYALKSPSDSEFMTSKSISYIFIPAITTYSSSRSAWIWPPSDFTVTLTCRATDASGGVVWETKITGDAHMRLPDVYRDHSLAGKEAIKNAFSELQDKILTVEAFR